MRAPSTRSARQPVFRRIKLLGMDDLKGLVLVFELLSNLVSKAFSCVLSNRHRGMPDRQHGAMILTLRVAEPDLVGPAGLHLRHHLCNWRGVYSDSASLYRCSSIKQDFGYYLQDLTECFLHHLMTLHPLYQPSRHQDQNQTHQNRSDSLRLAQHKCCP